MINPLWGLSVPQGIITDYEKLSGTSPLQMWQHCPYPAYMKWSSRSGLEGWFMKHQ